MDGLRRRPRGPPGDARAEARMPADPVVTSVPRLSHSLLRYVHRRANRDTATSHTRNPPCYTLAMQDAV